MPTGRYAKTVGVLAFLVVGAIACGPATGQDSDDGGDRSSKPTTTKPAAQIQDLCGELDAASMRKIAAAIGPKAEVEVDGEAFGAVFLPASDICHLDYTGAKVPKPTSAGDGDREVIREGEAGGAGGFEIYSSIAPMKRADYQRERRQAKATAGYNQAPVSDVEGLGDAAFYSAISSVVFADGRLLEIRDNGAGDSKARFKKVAEVLLSTAEGLGAPQAEVTEPVCDELTGGAEAVLRSEIEVRRDRKQGSRTFCSWAARTRSFQVYVSGDDDPEKALKQLRKANSGKVAVGDEGYYLTSPYRKVIFRSGDKHYEAASWAFAEKETTKAKTVQAVQRFAVEL